MPTTPGSSSLIPKIALALSTALCLGALVTGCSSDNSTGIVDAVPGDPDSHEYGSVSDVLGGEAFSLTGVHWHSLLEGELPGAVHYSGA